MWCRIRHHDLLASSLVQMKPCWSCCADVADGAGFCPACGKPQRFGKLAVIRQLGEGAFGAVYLASDDQLKRQVAVKSLLDHRSIAKEYFTREGATMATMRHDNIVAVFEASADPAYIVMEYVDGGSLRDMITAQTLSRQRIGQLLLQVCAALHHAHCKGVIHRDLKPENVLVDRGENARLSDFGLARLLEGSAAHTHAGTAAYMAPEVHEGTYDARCDLFSLGVMAYELYVGRRPYDEASTVEYYRAKVDQRARPPHEVDVTIPQAISTVIMRLLSADPEKRFQTAAVTQREIRVAAREYPSITAIDDFQRLLAGIYAGINARRDEGGILSQLVVHASSLLKLSMQAPSTGLLQGAIAQCAAWLFAYANIKSWETSKVIAGKYSRRCPYCSTSPCACRDGLVEKAEYEWRDAPEISGIREHQALFAELYEERNRRLSRVEVTSRLVLEVAELVEVHTKIPADSPTKGARQKGELADCFAWIFALAIYDGIDLERALNATYPGICKRCEKPTCQCKVESGILTHKHTGLL